MYFLHFNTKFNIQTWVGGDKADFGLWNWFVNRKIFLGVTNKVHLCQVDSVLYGSCSFDGIFMINDQIRKPDCTFVSWWFCSEVIFFLYFLMVQNIAFADRLCSQVVCNTAITEDTLIKITYEKKIKPLLKNPWTQNFPIFKDKATLS